MAVAKTKTVEKDKRYKTTVLGKRFEICKQNNCNIY